MTKQIHINEAEGKTIERVDFTYPLFCVIYFADGTCVELSAGGSHIVDDYAMSAKDEADVLIEAATAGAMEETRDNLEQQWKGVA